MVSSGLEDLDELMKLRQQRIDALRESLSEEMKREREIEEKYRDWTRRELVVTPPRYPDGTPFYEF